MGTLYSTQIYDLVAFVHIFITFLALDTPIASVTVHIIIIRIRR